MLLHQLDSGHHCTWPLENGCFENILILVLKTFFPTHLESNGFHSTKLQSAFSTIQQNVEKLVIFNGHQINSKFILCVKLRNAPNSVINQRYLNEQIIKFGWNTCYEHRHLQNKLMVNFPGWAFERPKIFRIMLTICAFAAAWVKCSGGIYGVTIAVYWLIETQLTENHNGKFTFTIVERIGTQIITVQENASVQPINEFLGLKVLLCCLWDWYAITTQNMNSAFKLIWDFQKPVYLVE